MRQLVRLVLLIAITSALFAGAVVTVPLVLRGLYRHGTSSVAEALTPLSSSFREGSTVYASNGSTVLATLQASKTQLPVKFGGIALILRRAVLDTEDERFYEHGGIDLPSTIRALLSDSEGNDIQGGSTITQQLVKQVYLNSERKLSRKVREAVIADRLEKLYTKNDILDAYLNTVYLGSGAYGVEAAAKAYWGETAKQVTLPQAAMLAGLIQAPSDYDPVSDPALALRRRTVVLGRMLHYKTITRSQYAAANAAPLPTSATITQKPLTGIDGYYVAQVESQLLGPGSPLGATLAERRQSLFEGGLKIYTNLNLGAQAKAEAAVLAKTPVPPENDQGLEENLVSLDPANGDVRAMIAGQNYATADNGFDVVTDGNVQPGSGFKIFTLLAALQKGDSIEDPVDGTAPCAIGFPGNTGYLTNPAHNDEGDGNSVHETTILNATAESLNCAYLRIGHQIGLPAVIAEAERLGIPASTFATTYDDPSIIIGTVLVKPLEMAAAYATLASGGTYHTPRFINHVVDRTGTTIYRENTKGRVVVAPSIVAEADVAFQAVVQYGTGVPAKIPGREVAGKTGTNSGPSAAWFNGYTPQLETTVWMGNPKGGVATMLVGGSEVYGATFAAPTVQAYMAAALAGLPDENFPALDYATLPRVQAVPEASVPIPGSNPVNPYDTQPTYGYVPPASTVTTSATGGKGTTPPTTPGTSPATTPATTPSVTTRTSTSTPAKSGT